MRISSTTFTDNFLRQIGQLQQQETNLQSQASTGLKMSLPEDDPATMRQVLNLQNQAAETSQYSKNISSLQSSTLNYSTAIQSLQSVMNQAATIATNASNGTSTDTSSYLAQVQGLIQQAVTIGNTQDANGNYIFSGITSDTKPFLAQTDSSGNFTSVRFVGNPQVNQVPIAPNLTVASQVSGAVNSGTGAMGLFQDNRIGGDIFAHLISLQNNIIAGNKAAIASNDVPGLNTDINNVSDQLSENAAQQSLLNSTASSLDSKSTTINTQISNLTSADMATTLTRLQQTQTAYQAALQSGVKVFSLSLLDYIH